VRTICSLVDFEIGCTLSCLDVVEGERMFSRAGKGVCFFILAELGFPEFFGLFLLFFCKEVVWNVACDTLLLQIPGIVMAVKGGICYCIIWMYIVILRMF